MEKLDYQKLNNYRLKEAVYSKQGSLLVEANKPLNRQIVDKLLRHHIEIYDIIEKIESDNSDNIIDQVQLYWTVNKLKTVFEDSLHSDRSALSSCIPEQSLHDVRQIVDRLMALVMSSHEVLFCVMKLIDTDDLTYQHCIHVAILSILLAKQLGYHDDMICEIALGALLHDIGKIEIDYRVLYKPVKLTDEEFNIVKAHAARGYDIVKNIESLSDCVKDIVHYHHEKLDGTGYPNGLAAADIPAYVRIVTVSDIYDAMVAQRSYRAGMAPYKVVDVLLAESIYKIDKFVVEVLISSLNFYPPGSGVILSDGRIGIIASVYKKNRLRPRVRILNFEQLGKANDFEVVDLSKSPTLFIESAWDVNEYAYHKKKQLSNSIH